MQNKAISYQLTLHRMHEGNTRRCASCIRGWQKKPDDGRYRSNPHDHMLWFKLWLTFHATLNHSQLVRPAEG